MLISEIDGIAFAPEHPELVGNRVLVTGASGALADDLLRAFAEARTRLVAIPSADAPLSPETRGFVQTRAMAARFLEASDSQTALESVRAAVQHFGGIDTLINVVSFDETVLGYADDAESYVRDLLTMPCLATRVAANRMRMTMTEGSILTIVAATGRLSARGQALASITRAMLSGFTRSEAGTWSRDGIRINAIAPGGDALGPRRGLSLGPDVATLAKHLASSREHALSGLTFEAYAA